MTNSMELVNKVKNDLYEQLCDVDGVGGIGITPDTGSGLGVKVIVHSASVKDAINVADEVHGVTVVVKVQGPVAAY